MDVITAAQFKRAVTRSELSVTRIAELLGVRRGQVYDYMNDGIRKAGRVEQVRRVMGLWLVEDFSDPFGGYSDDQLIAELHRRLIELRGRTPDGNEPGSPERRPAESDSSVATPGGGQGRFTGPGGPPSAE